MEKIGFEDLIRNFDLIKLKSLVIPYVNELRDFQFRVGNPLFWVFFLIAMILLTGFWRIKKAFSFCAIIALILLATTAIERSMGITFSVSELFDAMVLRWISLFIMLFVSLYFFFVRND